LYVVTLPQVVGFTLLALFVQTLVPNKFLGHGIVIGTFLLVPILYNWGLENTLYLPGQVPAYTYSDMNGYGYFVPGLLWSTVYWCALFGVLGVLSIALARRGAETSLGARMHAGRRLAPRLAPLAILFVLAAAGSGAWFYYNAHVLNEYLTAADRRHIQA